MKPEIKERWIKALSEYPQGRGQLRIEDAYCCLGVLCDLYSKEYGIPWTVMEGIELQSKQYKILEASSYLPPTVVHWAGLEQANPQVVIGWESFCLSDLNDGYIPSSDDDGEEVKPISMTFEEIARVIKEQL